MRRGTFLRRIAVIVAFAISVATATATLADEAKIPQTAAEHEALVKFYREHAAEYRKVAVDHKAMAEAYKKSSAPDPKGGGRNPWVVKMENHCQALARDAEKLAADADKAADYHVRRAKELQGK